MPSKSKTKGNSFEREVSTFLSAVYKESFIRVPTSGAFVGGKNSFRKTSLGDNQLQSKKGDIHPPDTWKYWNCECKSYADFPFNLLIEGDAKILDKWIEQMLEAGDTQDLNLIFIKINRKGKWVVFQESVKFEVKTFVNYKGWYFTSWDDFWGSQSNIDLIKENATSDNKQLLMTM